MLRCLSVGWSTFRFWVFLKFDQQAPMDDRKSTKDRLDFQTIFTNRLTDGCRIWITLNIKPFSSGDVKSIYHRRKFFISVKYVQESWVYFLVKKSCIPQGQKRLTIKFLTLTKKANVKLCIECIMLSKVWRNLVPMFALEILQQNFHYKSHCHNCNCLWTRSTNKTGLVSRHVITNNI